jgi:hypothetical protein
VAFGPVQTPHRPHTRRSFTFSRARPNQGRHQHFVTYGVGSQVRREFSRQVSGCPTERPIRTGNLPANFRMTDHIPRIGSSVERYHEWKPNNQIDAHTLLS